MKPAIRVENISKRYRVGSGPKVASTLTESLARAARRLTGRTRPDETGTFWALQGVTFDVRPGDVVGVIGRNGAGKSTLLKVLSRIVEPTGGRAEVRGRLGSLLEVGTGFHPELTGRENTYLNGSLLGMSRREIDRKFDEIVAFSGVERFLDTPVKRYSSGMSVRLAFAVAAHLEPEILIVDEVLAVGDGEFQRRCFQKMDQIRRSGRTILVVSHNLGAIQTLCTRAIQIEKGKLIGDGDVAGQVANYLSRLTTASEEPVGDRTDREGQGRARVVGLTFRDERDQPGRTADLIIETAALSCWSPDGVKLFHVDTAQRGDGADRRGPDREYVCRIPKLPLAPGLYHWNVMLTAAGGVQDHVTSAAVLEVLPGDFFRTGQTAPAAQGAILVDHDWM
jgi:lipopolysaccharide transport system ATP-binding protein